MYYTSKNQLYFFQDFETGGYAGTSILSFYGCVTDDKFNVLKEEHFNLRPEDGIYRVEAQALDVNKIDIVKHWQTGISKGVAVQKIHHLIHDGVLWGDSKLFVAGHNVHFDMRHLEALIGEQKIREYLHRHQLDTGALAVALKHKGKLPADLEISLWGLAKHYGCLPSNKSLHEAKTDVETTIKVLKCMLQEI